MSPLGMSHVQLVSSASRRPRVVWRQRCLRTAWEAEAAEVPSLRTHSARRASQQSAEAGGRWDGCGVSDAAVHVSGCSEISWPHHVSSPKSCAQLT